MLDKKIMFYHATETSMIAVLLELLKKSFDSHKKCLVHTHSPENATWISDNLWQLQDDFIVPHGLITQEMPDKQPILITHQCDNINNADYIFFIGQVDIIDTANFERYIVIFDDTDDAIKAHIREQYKSLRNTGKTVVYYQQQQGKWILK